MKAYDRMTTAELVLVVRDQDRVIAALTRELTRAMRRRPRARGDKQLASLHMSAARMAMPAERRQEIARMGATALWAKRREHTGGTNGHAPEGTGGGPGTPDRADDG